MSDNGKIVTFAEEVPKELLELIGAADVELIPHEKYDGNSEGVGCVILKDHVGPYKLVSQQFDSFLSSVPLVSIGDVENRADFIASGGRMIINESIIGNTVCDALLKRINTGDSSIHLEDVFGDQLDFQKNIKISSILGVGYYSDIVSYDAHVANFNAVSIRGFITNVTAYFAYLFREGLGSYPLDVEYGKNADSFILQFCVPVSNFISEYIYESFASALDRHNPFKSLLGQSLDFCDLMDICYSSTSGKLIISGVWRKSDANVKERFPSLIVSEIESFKRQEAQWDNLRNHPELALEQIRSDLEKEAAQVGLPGQGARKIINSADFFKRNPLVLKKVVRYVQTLRGLEDEPIPFEKLEEDDIANYLKDYPNPDLVEHMTSSDRQAVLNALLDSDSLNDVIARVKEVTDHLSSGSERVEGNPLEEDFFAKLLNGLEGMERFEFNEMVHGSFDEDKTATVVKGTKEDIGEENQMVSGTREDLTEDATLISGTKEDLGEKMQVVNGQREIISDDIWRVKGSGMKTEMRSAIMQVKSLGGGIGDVKKEIERIVGEHLNIKDGDANLVSSNVIQSIASNLAFEKLQEDEGPAHQVVGESETFRIAKLLEELNHKNITIDKLKKMVTALKVENGSNQSVKEIISSSGDDDDKMARLAGQVKVLERNIISRDQVIENLKIKMQRLGHKVASSNDALVNSKGIPAATGDVPKADYMKLKSNHDSIRAMLQVANNKVANMTEQLTSLRNQFRERDDVGLERLKDSLKNAQAKIADAQKEKMELQSLLKKARVELEAMDQKQSSDSLVEKKEDKKVELQLREKEKMAERLKDDLNKSNLKQRELMQKLNDQTRMVKALEIQIKNLSAQSSGSEAGVTNEQASQEDKLLYKIKQLETINERLEAASKKALGDLNERKKEIMQYKSENTMLKNKLQALERKVMRK